MTPRLFPCREGNGLFLGKTIKSVKKTNIPKPTMMSFLAFSNDVVWELSAAIKKWWELRIKDTKLSILYLDVS